MKKVYLICLFFGQYCFEVNNFLALWKNVLWLYFIKKYSKFYSKIETEKS